MSEQIIATATIRRDVGGKFWLDRPQAAFEEGLTWLAEVMRWAEAEARHAGGLLVEIRLRRASGLPGSGNDDATVAPEVRTKEARDDGQV